MVKNKNKLFLLTLILSLHSSLPSFAMLGEEDPSRSRTPLNQSSQPSYQTQGEREIGFISQNVSAQERITIGYISQKAREVNRRFKENAEITQAYIEGCCGCMRPVYKCFAIISSLASAVLIAIPGYQDSSAIRWSAFCTSSAALIFSGLASYPQKSEDMEDDTKSMDDDVTPSTIKVLVDRLDRLIEEGASSSPAPISERSSSAATAASSRALPIVTPLDRSGASAAAAASLNSFQTLVDGLSAFGMALYIRNDAEYILKNMSKDEDRLKHLTTLRKDSHKGKIEKSDQLILTWAGYTSGNVDRNIGSLLNPYSSKVRDKRWGDFVRNSISALIIDR